DTHDSNAQPKDEAGNDRLAARAESYQAYFCPLTADGVGPIRCPLEVSAVRYLRQQYRTDDTVYRIQTAAGWGYPWPSMKKRRGWGVPTALYTPCRLSAREFVFDCLPPPACCTLSVSDVLQVCDFLRPTEETTTAHR